MKQRQLGLVITRKLTKCSVRGLRNLPEVLGPVRARTFRQSSRIANAMRAGYPVHEYREMGAARVILICADREELAEIDVDLARLRRPWARTTVVILGAGMESTMLRQLGARGVSIASLAPVDSSGDLHFFLEGDPPAVRIMKKIVEGGGGRVIEIAAATQRLAAAAGALTTWMLMPWIEASALCLREAGLSRNTAIPIIERHVERCLRAYFRGGRRAWKGPAEAVERRAFVDQMAAMREVDPSLAAMVVETACLSLRRMGQTEDWLDEVRGDHQRGETGA